MALLERLQNVEKKYALTFVGFVVGIGFGILSIYTSFFQKKAPNLRYEIVSSASVFDVREDVGKLDILFNGVNIREKKQMLTLVTFTVSNTGNESITKALYDDKEPVGFQVIDGEIVRAEILHASNTYLAKNIAIKTEPASAVFAPVIIDAGDSFSVKVVILHNEKASPTIKPAGKIAGIREIELIPLAVKPAKAGFWAQVFEGSVRVQLTRSVAYFVLFLWSVFILVAPFAWFSDRSTKKRRKERISTFRKMAGVPMRYEFVIQSYLEDGLVAVSTIRRLLQEPEFIVNRTARTFHATFGGSHTIDVTVHQAANRLRASGLITKKDGQIVVDEAFRAFVDSFAQFLASQATLGEMAQAESTNL